MLDFRNAVFRYEPFPVGIVSNVFDEHLFAALVETFPDRKHCRHQPALGSRWTLARYLDPAGYRRFLASAPQWRELETWLRSREAAKHILETLEEQHIDLGRTRNGSRPFLRDCLGGLRKGRLFGTMPRFRNELVFSMLPADGGFLYPHTDSPDKIVNVTIAMMRPGEWDPLYGGATQLEWPNDPRKIFNEQNRRLSFEDVHSIDSIPVVANQAVVIVKTFNSWHSVRPMLGQGSSAMRKTININLLRY